MHELAILTGVVHQAEVGHPPDAGVLEIWGQLGAHPEHELIGRRVRVIGWPVERVEAIERIDTIELWQLLDLDEHVHKGGIAVQQNPLAGDMYRFRPPVLSGEPALLGQPLAQQLFEWPAPWHWMCRRMRRRGAHVRCPPRAWPGA